MAKGLLIKKKWLYKIFHEGKLWEMRSSHTHHRGLTLLIESGSGLIVGECRIIDSVELAEDVAASSYHHHHVDDLKLLKKWRFAWVLSDVKQYTQPIPYDHPQGAVIWVNLKCTTQRDL